MLECPYCGHDRLVKNGSTRGVPKWKGKSCGRQTSLRSRRAETDHETDKKRIEATLLSLSRRSLKAIAFLKSVVPSTVWNWVRQFAGQRAAQPEPGPGGVIVMERDEIWHFVGRKKTKLWIWLAVCTDRGQWVDWHCGDRNQGTLNRLLVGLAAWTVRLYCTDADVCYDQALPVGHHFIGTEETWRLEQIHSRRRHGLAR